MGGRRADRHLRGDLARAGVDQTDRVRIDACQRLRSARAPAEGEDRDRDGGGDHTGERAREQGASPNRPRLGDLFRLQRRELGLQPLDLELEERLGALDVLQSIRAEVAERDALDPVLDELAGRVRQQHLTAVGDRADPRRAMYPQPDVALLPDDGLSGMQPHPHAHLATLGPGVLRKRPLRDHHGFQRRVRAAEREEEPVALRVDLTTLARLSRLPEDAPVLTEHSSISVAEPYEQPCRAFDVREQEGDSALVQLGSKATLLAHSQPFSWNECRAEWTRNVGLQQTIRDNRSRTKSIVICARRRGWTCNSTVV